MNQTPQKMEANMRRAIATLFLVLSLCIGSSMSYSFVPLPDLTEGATVSASVVVGESIFLIGGISNISQYTISQTVREFNVRTRTWTSHPEYLYPVEEACAVSDGSDKINVFGGATNTDILAIRGTYTISERKWEYGNMPYHRLAPSCVWNSDTNKIHIINGFVRNDPTQNYGHWIYDPVTDSYDAGAKPLYNIYGQAGFFKNSEIYIAGTYLTKLSDQTWSALSTPPKRVYAGGIATNDALWMFGGTVQDWFVESGQQSSILRYDIASDTWTVNGTLPTPLTGATVALVGPSVFIIGGAVSSALDSMAVYTIPCFRSCPADTECEIYTCNSDTGLCEVNEMCAHNIPHGTLSPLVSLTPHSTPQNVPFSVPSAEPVAEPVVEPISMPVSEPLVEPISEPLAQPIAAPTTEPVSEPLSMPISETPSEPLSEPYSEPVVEPIAINGPASIPLWEPINEPVDEPIHAPVSEPFAEPFNAPTMAPVTSDVPLQCTTPQSTPQSVPQAGTPQSVPQVAPVAVNSPISSPASHTPTWVPIEAPVRPVGAPRTSPPYGTPVQSPTAVPSSLVPSDNPTSVPVETPVRDLKGRISSSGSVEVSLMAFLAALVCAIN